MDEKTLASDPTADTPGTGERSDEVIKTPVRPSKGTKRKLQAASGTPVRADDGSGSVKKRRRSSSGTALSRVGSPGTSLLKPTLTERQQMALLLQMTDPTKQQSPSSSPAVSYSGVPDTPETTPKSRGIQRKNERGETPLHIAAIKGDLKNVVSLLRQGADVRVTDHAGWTPLHEACNYGHSAVARELLEHDADVSAVGMDGDTPMHDAVVNGHLETVRVLLQHGGNPHRANDKGLTPIDICNNPSILTLLKSSLTSDPDHTHTGVEGQSTIKDDSMGDTTSERGAKTAEECPYIAHRFPSHHDNDDIIGKADEYTPVFSPEANTKDTSSALTTPTQEVASDKTHLRGVSFSDISSSESETELEDSENMVKEDDKVGGASEEVGGAPIESGSEEDIVKSKNDVSDKEESGAQILQTLPRVSTDPSSPASDGQGDGLSKMVDSKDASISSHLSSSDKDAQKLTVGAQDDNTSSDHGMDKIEVQPREVAPGRVLRSALKSPDSVGNFVVSISLSLVKMSLSGCGLKQREGHSRAGSEQAEDLSMSQSITHLSENIDSSDGNSNWREQEKIDSKESPPHETRRNSNSSVESAHSPCVSGEGVLGGERAAHTKHSRKPQHVFSGKKMCREGKREKKVEGEKSFSISLDWNSIKSPTDTSPSVLVTHGPIRTQSEDGHDYVSTPDEPALTQLPPKTENFTEQNSQTDSTVISFSTSLPLVFSGHQTTSTAASLTRMSASYKPKSRPSSPEGMRMVPSSGLSLSTPVMSFKRERMGYQGGRDVCSQPAEVEMMQLPPKKRFRSVARSSVIQQRLSHAPQVNEPTDVPIFSLATDYQSKKPMTPVSPKAVYPPLPSSMYKQFSEQEIERIKLATAHLTEQDRLRLSLIQELLRAQQRAKKGPAPLSACSVLLEKLLPPIEHFTSEMKLEGEASPSSKMRETDESVDARLLCGLVQDVWDKFGALKFSLEARQRHEAEALWLTQSEQWLHMRNELGNDRNTVVRSTLPTSHVPLVSLRPS